MSTYILTPTHLPRPRRSLITRVVLICDSPGLYRIADATHYHPTTHRMPGSSGFVRADVAARRKIVIEQPRGSLSMRIAKTAQHCEALLALPNRRSFVIRRHWKCLLPTGHGDLSATSPNPYYTQTIRLCGGIQWLDCYGPG